MNDAGTRCLEVNLRLWSGRRHYVNLCGPDPWPNKLVKVDSMSLGWRRIDYFIKSVSECRVCSINFFDG